MCYVCYLLQLLVLTFLYNKLFLYKRSIWSSLKTKWINMELKFIWRYFLKILLIDSELTNLKMDFFEVAFRKFCW